MTHQTPEAQPQQTIQLPAPAAPDAHEGWLHRDNGATAIILQPVGDIEILPADEELVKGKDGTYRVETRGRFWLPKPIPAGWLTVFGHGDPEPFTGRPALGYNAKTLEMLVGPFPVHVIGGGFQGRNEPQRWGLWLIVAALFLAAVAAVAVWYNGGI